MPVRSVSIVIPCLNEAATILSCINKAKLLMTTYSLTGEIIVADNGSDDNSQKIAEDAGVSVVEVKDKGYGSALNTGIEYSKSEYIIFADADDSYDFSEAGPFIEAFSKGFDVVVGNRYWGGIEKGAMPFLHRYLGTPIISFLGRKSFRVRLRDFNCGMRGVKKSSYAQLEMKSKGMEYASEMIAKASYRSFSIAEVPVKLHRDGRKKKPHLKTWSDGWKHLKLILLLSPKWLLLYPALFFLLIGLLLGISISFTQVRIFDVVLDIHTLYFCSIFLLIAVTFLEFYYMVSYYGISQGLYPQKRITSFISRSLSFEKGLVIGVILFGTGVLINAVAVYRWYQVSFQQLNPQEIFRIVIPGGFCMVVGLQFVVFSFFINLIRNHAGVR